MVRNRSRIGTCGRESVKEFASGVEASQGAEGADKVPAGLSGLVIGLLGRVTGSFNQLVSKCKHMRGNVDTQTAGRP